MTDSSPPGAGPGDDDRFLDDLRDRMAEGTGEGRQRLSRLRRRAEARLARAPRWVRSTVEVLRSLAHEWKTDRVSGLGAEVAFFAILALFPGLLALAALLGSLEPVFGAESAARIEATVLDFLRDTLDLAEGSTTLRAVESLFAESSPGLLTAGLVGALWSVSRGFSTVIKALDVAYDLDEHRPYPKLRGLAVLLSVGTVVVSVGLLVLMVVGPLLGAGEDVADLVGLGDAFVTFWDVLRPPVAVAVLVLWTATIFHVAPNHHTPWRADLPGAVVAAGLGVAGSLGFRFYLSVASGGNEVFGVLGSAVSLLLWLYVLALALLVGGELNAILWERRGEDKAEGSPGPEPATEPAPSDQK